MYLRKLKKNDAPLIYEWMHEFDVTQYMDKNFAEYTIEDCIDFVEKSYQTDTDHHMAICDDTDEYMGTVSLKNIQSERAAAEFAIIIRKKAMGNGYSKYALKKMLEIGINDMELKTIYWYVSPKNTRAIRFYEKNGFDTVDHNDKLDGILSDLGWSIEDMRKYVWFLYISEKG